MVVWAHRWGLNSRDAKEERQWESQPQVSPGSRKWAAQLPTELKQCTQLYMLQEVTVQVSQDTFVREGSRQQEQPQETLIYNGIWVKHYLLQKLSSQDIPQKPLERWGGKFLEVFGWRKQKSGLDFRGEITQEEKNVFNLIKSDLFTFITTSRKCASS